MAVSTIPGLKGALYDRLAADVNLGAATPAVGVHYGWPPAGVQGEYILVGNTRPEEGTDSTLFGGGQSNAGLRATAYLREERYVLEVIVGRISDRREPQRGVTERAFTLAGHIETSLRSWMAEATFVSVTGARSAAVTSLTHQEYATDTAREARLFMDIAVTARI